LFWLKTGSGKTAIGAGIVASYLMHEPNVPGEDRVIIVISSRENIKINDGAVYRKEIEKHYRPWNTNYKNMSGGKSLIDFIPSGGSKSKSVVKFWSYEKAYNAFIGTRVNAYQKVRDMVRNKTGKFAIIMDEIHDLASNDSIKTDKDRIHIQGLRDFFVKRAPFMVTRNGTPMFDVYGMTATPGDSIKEFARTLAMVGPVLNDPRNRQDQYIDVVESIRKGFATDIVTGLVLWRDPKHMVNTRGQSIFPKETVLNIEVPMTFPQYLLTMAYLGRVAKTSNANGAYTGPRNVNGLINENVLSKKGIQKDMFRKGYFNPKSSKWLDVFSSMQMYITQTELQRFFKTKEERQRIRSESFKVDKVVRSPNGTKSKIIGEWIRVQLPTRGGKNRIYYIPRGGKIHQVVQHIRKSRGTGRQLVFTKDPRVAQIIGKMLTIHTVKKGVSGNKVNEFEDSSDRFRTSDYPKGLDMMFRFPENGRPNLLRHRNVQQVITTLLRLHHQRQNNATTLQKRRFVVATNENMVSRASQTMSIDDEMTKVIRLLEDLIRSRQVNLQNTTELQQLLQKMKRYNLRGEELEVLIIGGGKQYQGLNIPALRKVYILDELHSRKQYTQLMGRGSRGFGHAELPQANRNVEIRRYISTIPKSHKGLGLVQKNNTGAYTRPVNSKNHTVSKIRHFVAQEFQLPDKQKNVIDTMADDVMSGMYFLGEYYHKLTGEDITPISSLTINKIKSVHRTHLKQHADIQNVFDTLQGKQRT
jgi:superfamily II DNA or RNA helicase